MNAAPMVQRTAPDGGPYQDRTLWYPVYDSVSQATAITANLSFTYFAVGQSSTKGANMTNLSQSGQMPNNWGLRAVKRGISIPANTAEVDIEHYQNSVSIALELDGTKVWESPVEAAPSGFGISGVAGATAIALNLGPAAPAATEVWSPPLLIPSGTNIVGTMTHHAAITLAAAVVPRWYLIGVLDQAITN